MKTLKRKHARVILVLMVICTCMMGVMLVVRAVGAPMAWMDLSGTIAVVSLVASGYLRKRWLSCPHCGKGTARPRWNSGVKKRCPHCGEPFVFDDDAD